jgi:predicted RNA binding protein YcfA (HicA-like mRNA interferase family)
MRVPRDLSGAGLAKALRAFGYEITRQDGSHLRLTTEKGGQHHLTIPNHRALKQGTLRSILKMAAGHHRLSVEAFLSTLEL